MYLFFAFNQFILHHLIFKAQRGIIVMCCNTVTTIKNKQTGANILVYFFLFNFAELIIRFLENFTW